MTVYNSFQEFYVKAYMPAHQNTANRRMHLLGAILGSFQFIRSVIKLNPLGLLWVPVFTYGCAWTGHYLFEKNTPLSFKEPKLSFMAEFVLAYRMLSGEERI